MRTTNFFVLAAAAVLLAGCAGPETLNEIAAALGSDIPFFLQAGPALASGRGEIIQPLVPFPALTGTALLLVQPGPSRRIGRCTPASESMPSLDDGEQWTRSLRG